MVLQPFYFGGDFLFLVTESSLAKYLKKKINEFKYLPYLKAAVEYGCAVELAYFYKNTSNFVDPYLILAAFCFSLPSLLYLELYFQV